MHPSTHRTTPRALKLFAIAFATTLFTLSLLHAFTSTYQSAPVPAQVHSRATAAFDFSGGVTCYVRVTDLPRSIAWYHDTLAFDLLFKVDSIGWAELKSPLEKLTIGLLQTKPGEKVATGGGATVVFGVKDLEAARAALEAAHVKFTGPTLVHEGLVKLAGFFDPDGNLFTLSQSLMTQPEATPAANQTKGGAGR